MFAERGDKTLCVGICLEASFGVVVERDPTSAPPRHIVKFGDCLSIFFS
jgi:hypothetical protein